MPKTQQIIKAEAKSIFAPNLKQIKFVKGGFLSECVSILPRLKCQNCGLYGRALLCPPLLAQTYPQFQTIDESKSWYANTILTAAVFVFQNDGTLPWKRRASDLSHIEFKRRYGRQLKGVENGSAKAINKQMRQLELRLQRRHDKDAMALICGHCDICPGAHRCPQRENPPCKRRGLASMEATGLDVYEILNKLDIDYEYPALNKLTQVTTILIARKKPL